MKRPIRSFAYAAIAFGVLGSVMPARAVPYSGPPTVTIQAVPTSDPFTFHLQAHASDPDGRIRSLQICVAEGFDIVCTSSPSRPPKRVADLRACVQGDSADYARDHTFASYGVFSVTATAIGGGCPVVGSGDEESTARASVVVAPPGEPIVCADSYVPTAIDAGVTADVIRLGTTVNYESLEGRDAVAGIRAAIKHVNETGGVCGRMLDVAMRDDGGSASRGLQYYRNMIEEGVFALVAGPSGDSLRSLILSGDVDARAIPVVGTLGQTDAEFTSPWVFPVAPSSTDFGKIAVRHAVDGNAAHLALVYAVGDRSSLEARQGVLDAVASNPGVTLDFEAGLQPYENSYAAVASQYAAACQNLCDALILVADPETAIRWFVSAAQQNAPKIPTLVMPRDVSSAVALNCGPWCSSVTAWTGFRAPALGAGPLVARYAADLAGYNPTIDPNEAFAEGAYAGTMALARAMGMAGTHLTRMGLRTILETQSIDLGLTRDPLSWPANHNANPPLQGLSMAYSANSFVGWTHGSDWTTP